MTSEAGLNASDTSPSGRAPMEEPVAVVIVNYRTPELTIANLKAVARERADFRQLRAIVVDGGSADGSAEKLASWIERSEWCDWIEFRSLSVNGGFGWANNQAIQHLMRGRRAPEYIHLLNPDAEVETGGIILLADYLKRHARTAAVGSQLLEPDGSLSGSAFRFPSVGSEFARGARTQLVERLFGVSGLAIDADQSSEVDWVTGASVMFRVEALREVGLFDEGFFLYYEEVELMWRLRRAGWTIATEPRSRVRHVGGAATGVSDRTPSTRLRPRKPSFLYRSRARFFALTGGRTLATSAFAAWLVGHIIWHMRRLFRLAADETRVDHELADHLLRGFPRKHDRIAAIPMLDDQPTDAPAWMCNRWL